LADKKGTWVASIYAFSGKYTKIATTKGKKSKKGRNC